MNNFIFSVETINIVTMYIITNSYSIITTTAAIFHHRLTQSTIKKKTFSVSSCAPVCTAFPIGSMLFGPTLLFDAVYQNLCINIETFPSVAAYKLPTIAAYAQCLMLNHI